MVSGIGREVIEKEVVQGLDEIVNAAAMMKKLMKDKEQVGEGEPAVVQEQAPHKPTPAAGPPPTSLMYIGALKVGQLM